MFLRSLPEKLDTEKKEEKSMNLIKIIMNLIKNDQSPQSFRSCSYEHGNFILGVNFRQQRGKRTFPSTLYYMPGLQNLPTTLQSYTNPGSHFF